LPEIGSESEEEPEQNWRPSMGPIVVGIS
jgi:hypothetical protein